MRRLRSAPVLLAAAAAFAVASLAGGPAGAAGGGPTRAANPASGPSARGASGGSSLAAIISSAVPTNINVSRRNGNQSEATISINPTNPNNLVVTSNIDVGNGLFYAVTMDGGAHWMRKIIADGDNLGTACCDSKAVFDRFGNYFLVYLDAAITKVQAAASTDGGLTLQYLGKVNTSGSPDFCGITVGDDSVWFVWTNTSANTVQARGVHVSGLGQFGPAGPVESAPGSANDSFADIAVGPEGQVLVTYQHNGAPFEGPSDIFVNLDPDGFGPMGFTNKRKVLTGNVGSFDSIPAMDSRTVLASVNLEWDRSGGPFDGRVHLIYNDEFPNESDNTEIVELYSDDNGATWSGRIRVNDDATNRSQFLPWASLDQTTGWLAASWHDARMDAGDHTDGDTNGIRNDDAQFWAAVSKDGGVTWETNIRVSAGTSNEDQAQNGIDYGDYTGLSFHAGVFYPIWADNSNSTGDNPNGTLNQFDLYTARVQVS